MSCYRRRSKHVTALIVCVGYCLHKFVGAFGGHGNMAAVRVAMHAALWRRGVDPLAVDPWYFPTPNECRRLLELVSRQRWCLCFIASSRFALSWGPTGGRLVIDLILNATPTIRPQRKPF